MHVAVLGMGSMGRAFAARALERGHRVTVWNRSPGRAGAVVSAGATEASSSRAAVAGVDAVLMVLTDDAAVVDVCLGNDGVLAALGPAAVFCNISTVAPATARRLAKAGPEGRVLDSPVMGGPAGIIAGRGTFFIGGPLATIQRLDPLWADLGAGYTHCGPAGTGTTLKVVSNLILITGVASLAEGIVIARRQGIPDDLLKRILEESPLVAAANKLRLPSLFDGAHPGWFTPALARKDLRLAIDLAREGEVGVRLGPAAEAMLTKVIDNGQQWPDFAAVIEALKD
jgi:3-hydroxyisobutyrate dehydrogenase-like beta-hydroxyacid dehydrogenase